MRLNFLNGFPQLARTSGVEAESWIVKTCKKYESLYLGSVIMNNETLRKAQQNRRMSGINCVRSRESRIRRFRLSDFQIFLQGSLLRNAFGADSPLVSPVILLLNVQLQKTPHLDKTNDDTEKQWSKIYIILVENRSLDTKETIQNETT